MATSQLTLRTKKKLSNRPFVPVNNTAAPALGGQSRKKKKNWTQGHVFTKYVQIQSILTCLVSDLMCHGLGG